jgi:peptidoglycan-associated lipoprotein
MTLGRSQTTNKGRRGRSRDSEPLVQRGSRAHLGAVVVMMAIALTACHKNKPPLARPTPPQPSATNANAARPPGPPEPVAEPAIVPPEPVREDGVSSASLDDLNRNSPLKPAFFDYDSAELNTAAQAILQEDAGTLKRYGTWTITIEGHCDERGTAEYNLALGERRAVAARTYLVSLGISADRLRTVSYGKEFPFDPGHDESAYTKNRRAHFVITAK